MGGDSAASYGDGNYLFPGGTVKIVRRLCAAVVACLLVLLCGTAYADNIQNDLVASGPTTITLSGGTASTTMKYYVHESGGCDVSPTKPSTYRVNVAGTGVTASPSEVTFTTCDGTARQTVSFTATSAGSREVTLSRVSGESLNENPAKFTLVVNAPSNTAPVVAVAGVGDGSTFEHGTEPSPACTVTDAEDSNPTATPSVTAVAGPLAAYGLGSRTATCSYTDGGGITRTASATYRIVDTTQPVLDTPGDQVLEATGPGGASASWTVTGSDNVALASPASCSPSSGHTFPLGQHTVTCEATDVAGNSRTGTFTVTVRDTTGPSLVTGNDVTREATGPDGATATYEPATATDVHDGELAPACDPASGSRFPLGDTVVTCSVQDASGNDSTGTLTVRVRDTTGPVIDVPADRTVEATSPAGATLSYDVDATDAVDGPRAATCSPVTGATFGFGDTTVECTAEDTRGNASTATFVVTVEDTVKPALSVPDAVTAEADGPAGTVVDYDVSATDAADADVTVDCIPAAGYRFPLGGTAVSCTAVDDHGNTTQKSFEVSVVDTTAPAVSVPDDRSLEATGPDGAPATYAAATASDTVDGDLPATCAPASGSTFPLGASTIICSATDAAGNTGSSSFTVSVVDTTGPVIVVPGDRNVEADRPGGARPAFEATATDLVDGGVTVECAPPSASLFGFGPTTVTCSATDDAGNTSRQTFTVTVADTVAPELVLPEDRTVEATGADGAAVEYDVSATDAADDDVDVHCAPGSGDTFPLGTSSVGCTATDDHDNASAGAFNVTVVDTTAPSLTMPEDVTAEATGPDGAAVQYVVATSDLVDDNVTLACDPVSGSTFGLGTTTVECTATDDAGNATTGDFDVTVVDTTAPEVTAPADQVVEATGPDGATTTYQASASDVVDGDLDATCVPASGSSFALGAHEVTCTATDDAGNTGHATFAVSVVDTTGPAITVPADATVEAVGPHGARPAFEASATDLVDGPTPVTCEPPSESVFGLGVTLVTCSSEDSRGNHSTETFRIGVADTTAPDLTVPGDWTVEATGPDGAEVDYSASATDLVDEHVAVACVPPSGSTFALGGTDVTCTAEDDHDNVSSASFAITVEDTTAPSLTVPDDLTVEATGPGGAAVSWSTSATDIVDGSVTPECTPASGSTFALGTHEVTCTATDAAGNVRTKTFGVTVRDTTAPSLDVPDPITAEATGPDGARVVYLATTRDTVDDNVHLVCDPASNTVFALGTTTVTCTATDFAGNHRSKSFTVTVRDTTGPVLALPGSRTAQATSAAGAPVGWSATAADTVSGAVPVGCSPASGSTFAPGTTTVTCSATDDAGNTSTGTFTVTVSFGWNGFFAPVDNNGTVNLIKGGQSVPLKWNVPNGSGGWIGSLAIVSSVRQTTVACQSGASADEIEAPTSGATSLRYDATANQYIYNWQSPKTPVGACYKLSVNLTDGSSRSALFRTK